MRTYTYIYPRVYIHACMHNTCTDIEAQSCNQYPSSSILFSVYSSYIMHHATCIMYALCMYCVCSVYALCTYKCARGSAHEPKMPGREREEARQKDTTHTHIHTHMHTSKHSRAHAPRTHAHTAHRQQTHTHTHIHLTCFKERLPVFFKTKLILGSLCVSVSPGEAFVEGLVLPLLAAVVPRTCTCTLCICVQTHTHTHTHAHMQRERQRERERERARARAREREKQADKYCAQARSCSPISLSYLPLRPQSSEPLSWRPWKRETHPY